ncbi:hypothetical protein RvY_00139 [Ramazzottius varieornatus]|uniref:PiggyBac transposable element-derived protein domain-containing protein n=1 Tax=Ramazzottius varieornatus TaxID=947166 RepID=A0A1D1UBN2_RAMVA|nr:hypothetical protein RvY_00139 [Ramazzottius varieornatus]
MEFPLPEAKRRKTVGSGLTGNAVGESTEFTAQWADIHFDLALDIFRHFTTLQRFGYRSQIQLVILDNLLYNRGHILRDIRDADCFSGSLGCGPKLGAGRSVILSNLQMDWDLYSYAWDPASHGTLIKTLPTTKLTCGLAGDFAFFDPTFDSWKKVAWPYPSDQLQWVEDCLRRLMKRLRISEVSDGDDSGRNVTTDNFFTSLALGEALLKKNISLIGTIRKSRPEIPSAFLPSKYREVHSSLFGHTSDFTLVSYVPKKGKAVTLLSSMHLDADIDESSKEEKPEIVMEYNRTKAGVDTLDQLTGNYSCRRKTSRWPMALFYDILDISALDAYIIWCEINPGWNSTLPTKRRMFLQDVSKKMMQRQLLRRSTTPTDDKQSISYSLLDGAHGIALMSQQEREAVKEGKLVLFEREVYCRLLGKIVTFHTLMM